MFRNKIHWIRAVSGMPKHKHTLTLVSNSSSRGGKRKSYPGGAGTWLVLWVCQALQGADGYLQEHTLQGNKGCIRSFMIKSRGFRSPHTVRMINRSCLLQIFTLQKKAASTAKSLWKMPLKPAVKLEERWLQLRCFGGISCTWKILLSKHCNEVKAKQAGAVAPYTETWAKKLSVRELFPKALPVIVHREARVWQSWAWFRLPWWSTKELGMPNYQGERVLS